MAEFFTNTYLGIFLTIVGQCLLIIVPLLVALAFLLYFDRKVWAAVHMRRGPNVVGAFGLAFDEFRRPAVVHDGIRIGRGRDAGSAPHFGTA